MDMILDEYKTTLQVIEVTKGYWDRTTGEYVEGAKTEVDFIGAVLPISQDDFRKNPDGGYTREDRKVYTNKDLTNGQVIVWNNFKWNAESDLDYSYIDPDFKRYFMRRAGKVSD